MKKDKTRKIKIKYEEPDITEVWDEETGGEGIYLLEM